MKTVVNPQSDGKLPPRPLRALPDRVTARSRSIVGTALWRPSIVATLLMLFGLGLTAGASEREQRHVRELVSDRVKQFDVSVSPTLFPSSVTNDMVSLLGFFQKEGFILRTTNSAAHLTRLLGESGAEYWSYGPEAGLFIARKADNTNRDNFISLNWPRKLDRVKEFLDFGMIYVNAETIVWTAVDAFRAKDWKGNPVTGKVTGRDAAGRPTAISYGIESAAMEEFALKLKYGADTETVPFSAEVEIRGKDRTISGTVNVNSLSEVPAASEAKCVGYSPGDCMFSDTKIDKITIYSNGVRHAMSPDGGLVPYAVDLRAPPRAAGSKMPFLSMVGSFGLIAIVMGVPIARQIKKGRQSE
jgi:hypothetical protein